MNYIQLIQLTKYLLANIIKSLTIVIGDLLILYGFIIQNVILLTLKCKLARLY